MGYLSSGGSISTSDKAQCNDLRILLRTEALLGMTGFFGDYTQSCILILRLEFRRGKIERIRENAL